MDRLTRVQIIEAFRAGRADVKTFNALCNTALLSLSQEAVRDEALEEIMDEVQRATSKFPTWPTDPLHAAAVLGEEFGELTKAMLQLTYEPHKTSKEEVHKEALQTAAMAYRLYASLDRYDYKQGQQHEQSALKCEPNAAAQELTEGQKCLARASVEEPTMLSTFGHEKPAPAAPDVARFSWGPHGMLANPKGGYVWIPGASDE